MTPISTAAPHAEGTRPRVEGDREQEIFDATLQVLEEVGYDRLTMDAVAAAARASKATLYRRWNGKVALVIDALLSQKGPHEMPDTGSLRGDLLATFCGVGGLTDHSAVATFASVLTAISRDAEFAAAFRERVIGPKAAMGRAIFERARARGELREGRRPRPVRSCPGRHLSAPAVPDGPAARPGRHRPRGRPDHPARRARHPRDPLEPKTLQEN